MAHTMKHQVVIEVESEEESQTLIGVIDQFCDDPYKPSNVFRLLNLLNTAKSITAVSIPNEKKEGDKLVAQ